MAQTGNFRGGWNRSLIGLLILAVSLIGLYIALRLFLLPRKKQNQGANNSSSPESQANEIGSITEFHNLVRETLPEVDEYTRKLITAQAMHETGIFKSKIYKENNNAFGMRMPHKRETVAFDEQNGYAMYDSVADSIVDLQMWFDYNNISLVFSSPAEYAEKIKQVGYYEAPYADYSRAMENHLKTVEASA